MCNTPYECTVWKDRDGKFYIKDPRGDKFYDPGLGWRYRRFQSPQYQDYKKYWFKWTAIRVAKKIERRRDEAQRRAKLSDVKVWR